MPLIPVTAHLAIDDAALEERFVRASGPGGQNVNKVATAVELRLDIGRSGLPEGVLGRLAILAGRRLTKDGILVIEVDTHRTQDMNRIAARDRLFALVRAAAVVPRKRRPTRPTLASKERRLGAKSRRGEVKRLRGRKPAPE